MNAVKYGVSQLEAGRLYGVSPKTISNWHRHDIVGDEKNYITQIDQLTRELDNYYRVIGKLQQERLDELDSIENLPELQSAICRWLNDYHFFRPHQALNYLTPEGYCAKLDIAIPRARVSTM
jgi:transposase InsO family protein